MLSPRLLYASVSREKGGGGVEGGLVAICKPFSVPYGDLKLVRLGHFVCTVLEVRFRAIPSESQAVLIFVGASSAGPSFMIYYPVYEVGLNFRMILAFMVQLG